METNIDIGSRVRFLQGQIEHHSVHLPSLSHSDGNFSGTGFSMMSGVMWRTPSSFSRVEKKLPNQIRLKADRRSPLKMNVAIKSKGSIIILINRKSKPRSGSVRLLMAFLTSRLDKVPNSKIIWTHGYEWLEWQRKKGFSVVAPIMTRNQSTFKRGKGSALWMYQRRWISSSINGTRPPENLASQRFLGAFFYQPNAVEDSKHTGSSSDGWSDIVFRCLEVRIVS